jgi:hypothetical protein
MHVNLIKEQDLYISLEHSLASLVLWCTSNSEYNIRKWQALLDFEIENGIGVVIQNPPRHGESSNNESCSYRRNLSLSILFEIFGAQEVNSFIKSNLNVDKSWKF